MPTSYMIRNTFFAVVAVFLTAAILTACSRKGDEDLRKGKAAYEAQDYETAVKHFTLAADQGNAEAQFALGHCYEFGKGVETNDEEAAKWYRLAADQGHLKAKQMLEINDMIDRHIDDVLNKDESHWQEVEMSIISDDLRKATEENNVESQLYLGDFYDTFKKAEAAKWYRMAAENGNAKAQYKLGSYFESGEGVEQQDKAEATKWYRMAAAQGYAPAAGKLKDLGEE